MDCASYCPGSMEPSFQRSISTCSKESPADCCLLCDTGPQMSQRSVNGGGVASGTSAGLTTGVSPHLDSCLHSLAQAQQLRSCREVHSRRTEELVGCVEEVQALGQSSDRCPATLVGNHVGRVGTHDTAGPCAGSIESALKCRDCSLISCYGCLCAYL